MSYIPIDSKNREYYFNPEVNSDGVFQTDTPSKTDDKSSQVITPRRQNVSVQSYNADFTDGHRFKYDDRIQDRRTLEGKGLSQNEARAEAQPLFNAVGNAVGNNLAIAGTTFLGNTVGLLANVISADYDNDVSRWSDKMQQRTSAALPIYQKKGYEDMTIWQKMGTQSFWAEQVKSAGFTEGMLLSQALYNVIPGVGAFIAPIASSVGEATTEALQAKNDKMNAETQVLYDEYNRQISNPDLTPIERRSLYDDFTQTLSDIDNDVNRTGNFVFALNVGLLSLTNWAAWSTLVSPKKAAVERAKSEARKNISREVIDGVSQTGMGQARFQEGKHLVLDSKAKAAAKFISNQLLESTEEGIEEVSQDSFKKAADTVSAFNSFASSDFNPDKRITNDVNTVSDWLSQIIDGYAQEFQDPQWAESFASGFLMRAIGSPMVRSTRSADGSFQSPIFLAGSIHEAMGFNREYNEKQKLVNDVNQMVDDRNLKPLIDMLVQRKGFTDEINEAIENGDELSAQNASWASLVSLVNSLRKTGHMDILDDIISESGNLSNEQLDALTKDENGNPIYTVDEVKEGIKKHTDDLRKAVDSMEKATALATRVLGINANKQDIENYAINKTLESDMSSRQVSLLNDILDFIETIEKQYPTGTDFKTEFITGSKTLSQIMKDAQADNKNIDFVEYAEAEQKLKDSNALTKNIRLLQDENKKILENNKNSTQKSQKNNTPAGQQNQPVSNKSQTFKTDLQQYTSVKDMKQRILDEFNDAQGLDESEVEAVLKELSDGGNQVAKDFIDFYNYKIALENELQGMNLTSQEKQDVKDILDLAFKKGDSLDMFRDRRNPILNDSKTLENISANKNDIPIRFRKVQNILLQAIDKTDNSARYRSRFGTQANPVPASAPAANPAPASQGNPSVPQPQPQPQPQGGQGNPAVQQGNQPTSGVFASIYTNKENQYSQEDANYIRNKGGLALVEKGGVKRGDNIVFAVDQDFSPIKILLIHEKTGIVVGIVNSEDSTLKSFQGFSEWAKSVLDDVQEGLAPGTITRSSKSVKVYEIINGDIIRESEEKDLGQVVESRKQDNDGFEPVITFINSNGDMINSSKKTHVIRNASEMKQNKGEFYILCPMPDGTTVGERLFVRHINQNRLDILGKDRDNPFAIKLRNILDRMIQASKDADDNAFNMAVSDFKQIVYDRGLHFERLENGFVINKRQLDDNNKEIVDEVFNTETQQVEKRYREKSAYFSVSDVVLGEINEDNSVSTPIQDPEQELAEFLKQLYTLDLRVQINEQDMNNPSRTQEMLNEGIFTTNSTLRVKGSNIKTESVTNAPTTPATNNYRRGRGGRGNQNRQGNQPQPNPVGGQQSVVPGIKVLFEGKEYYGDTITRTAYLPDGTTVLNDDMKEEILARAESREKRGQPGAPIVGNYILLSTGKVYNFMETRFVTGAEAQGVIDQLTKPQPAPQPATPAAQPAPSPVAQNSLPDIPIFKNQNKAKPVDADSQRSNSIGIATFRLTRNLADGTNYSELVNAYVEPLATIDGIDVYFATIPTRNGADAIAGYRVAAIMPNGNSFSPGILNDDRIKQEGGIDAYKEKLAGQLAKKPEKVKAMASETIFTESSGNVQSPVTPSILPKNNGNAPAPSSNSGTRTPRRPPRRLPRLRETTYRVNDQININKEIEWLKKVLPQYSTEQILKIVDNIASQNGMTVHGFYNGINIVLSKQAESGTTYHEAFHAVVDQLLTDKQKADMLSQARRTYGEMSDYDLEERLAEDFRLYVMSNQEYVPESGLRRFFRHLYAKIQDMLRIQPSMTQLFYRINSGYYARQESVPRTETSRVQDVSSATKEYLDNIGVSEQEYLSLPKEVQETLMVCAGF